ncbi:MAG: transporter substrate-binding domain-containing protein [Paucibacter sp.]|nr:transporter substrate-binding domain-containing protein [Roseateles sp.]
MVLLATLTTNECAAAPISVCIQPGPPPWAYWQDSASNATKRTLTGISVETVRAAFQQIGQSVDIRGDLPWARCMEMVEKGLIDFAMDAFFDSERAKRFDYSIHYRSATPQIFFRRADPVVIGHVSELKRYRGCGLHGWSYEHYGLSKNDLDIGFVFENMVKKLKAKRCDYFVDEIETVYNHKFIGDDYLADPELGHGPVPGAQVPTSHLMTAKGSPASRLLPALDKALAGLIKSGQAEAIWAQHTKELPFKP